MSKAVSATSRPQRWDVPFDSRMSDQDVDRLLQVEPFRSIDPAKFPEALPLRGILKNDTRLVKFRNGDLVVREGDYGGSAFLILSGRVRVTLQSLPPDLLGRRTRRERGFLSALAQLWSNPRQPEVRRSVRASAADAAVRGGEDGETRVFLQDVPGVLGRTRTVELKAGEIFGELAALSRTPRTATVFAEGEAELLEIRWQGLRDLRRRAEALRVHIDRLYRERSLQTQLRETPVLGHLSDADLAEVARATEFETYGDFEWQAAFKTASRQDSAQRLAAEPLIAEQGHYSNGLILIRSGFARLSQRYGHGEKTLSYLGKGEVFGLAELLHSAGGAAMPYQSSLRAIGYVDVLRIPVAVVEKYILPRLPAAMRPAMVPPAAGSAAPAGLDSGTTEFLVEKRLFNGTAAMVINIDRCTRCDDCVRACAAAHDNNPRFVRHGPIYGSHMFASACMHCADPVCMIGCPTGAIHRDLTTGDVVINDLTCIGCSTCANSCPYHNIRMVETRDAKGRFRLDEDTHLPIQKATKCDLCVDQRGGPNCERACPHDALKRVDLRDPAQVSEWMSR